MPPGGCGCWVEKMFMAREHGCVQEESSRMSARVLQFLVRMPASDELVVSLALCLLIRLSRCSVALRKHPVLHPFLEVDPLYLHSR